LGRSREEIRRSEVAQGNSLEGRKEAIRSRNLILLGDPLPGKTCHDRELDDDKSSQWFKIKNSLPEQS
jgi:hypothetical protein